GKVAELKKYRELEWARVLKLVYENEIELSRQCCAHIRAAHEVQGQCFLIDEVHDAPLAFVLLVGGEARGRDVEQELDQPVQVRARPRMLAMAGRSCPHGRDGRGRPDGWPCRTELRPVAPAQPPQPKRSPGVPQELNVVRRDARRITRGIDGRKREVD